MSQDLGCDRTNEVIRMSWSLCSGREVRHRVFSTATTINTTWADRSTINRLVVWQIERKLWHTYLISIVNVQKGW